MGKTPQHSTTVHIKALGGSNRHLVSFFAFNRKAPSVAYGDGRSFPECLTVIHDDLTGEPRMKRGGAVRVSFQITRGLLTVAGRPRNIFADVPKSVNSFIPLLGNRLCYCHCPPSQETKEKKKGKFS